MPAAHAPRRWPSCPACGGRKLSRLPGWAPREAPGGCFFSSVALSTAPCQGSSGPFCLAACLLLLHLQGTTGALALSGSLARCRFGAGVSSALALPPFPQGFLPVQNSPCLEGLQACCPISSCHCAALPACNRSAGQAREGFSCITGQEAQRCSKFWKGERMLVIATRHALENSPWYHTPLLLLWCVVVPDPHSSCSRS